MQKAFIGGIGIAISCGLLAPFLVIRRQSLLGDGLAHFSFGGVALGLLFGIDPLWSALFASLLGSFIVARLVKNNFYGDAAIALILSFGVGLGVVLLGIVRGFNSDLYSYLIGSILSLNYADIALIYALVFANGVFFLFGYRALFHLSFHEELARLQFRRTKLVEIMFTILVAFTVAMSIRAVGILLVSALLVIPALIALKLAHSFKQTLVISVISAISAVTLGIVCAFFLNLPPGGAIVLLLFTGFVLVSQIKNILTN